MTSRLTNTSDLQAISLILDDTGLFPAEHLEEMITPFFQDPDCQDQWFVCEEEENGVIGFGYCRPELYTEGTWNLLAIGVRNTHQGRGAGTILLQDIERALTSARLLLVETSGLEDFAPARAFYIKCGYDLVATIPEYWAEHDDKVIFSKKLG